MTELLLWYFVFRFTLMYIIYFIILTNVNTLITLCFCVCRLNMKKKKTIDAIKKTFVQINQVMEVARAVTTVPVKNDDQYIWISMQVVVFSEIIICEN